MAYLRFSKKNLYFLVFLCTDPKSRSNFSNCFSSDVLHKKVYNKLTFLVSMVVKKKPARLFLWCTHSVCPQIPRYLSRMSQENSGPNAYCPMAFVLTLYGGGLESPPPPTVFCPLITKSSDDPYLKLLDFSHIFVADAPIKKNYTSSYSTLRRPFIKLQLNIFWL